MIDLNKYLAKPYKSVQSHTDDLLSSLDVLNALNYISDRCYSLLEMACKYHDYGKINNEFQQRVQSKGELKFNNNKEVAHNVLSLCFINKDIFDCDDDYYKVCYAVLNHHHYTDNYNELEIKRDLIKTFAQKFNAQEIKRSTKSKILRMSDDNEAQLIKGLLHKCDYSASGNYVVEYPNDFLIKSMDNLNYNWNELQEYCLANTNDNIIVTANTGMGKTEAGLLWIGDNKGFFILPLRTAINAIYDRIKTGIIDSNIDNKVALLHSDTLSYYLKETVVEDKKVIEYKNKGKQLSLPLTISTLDQLFNFVYKYNGFELKLATLSYSKIVIDEIQTYSPDLLAYIIYGLEQINKVGGKFAILTATLAPFVRYYLEENIGKIKTAQFVKGKDRHYLKSLDREIDTDFILDHYNKNKGKVLIVCNTVKKSQEVYDNLKDKVGSIELIHSKYTKKDRKIKEDKIIEFGKTELIADGIWVATSIVEASLDIDFDYLFTELNDLNGLFQRLGRVNRKGIKYNMLDKPNAYVFTKINPGILTNKLGTKGFIDSDMHKLSIAALLNFDGIISEEKKVELIDTYFTIDNIKSSAFHFNYIKMKKYIKALYIGEKKVSEVMQIFRNISSYNIIPINIYLDNKDSIEKDLAISEIEFEYDRDDTYDNNKQRQNLLYLNKIKAQERILDLTLSVGVYDINKNVDHEELMVGYDIIKIVDCDYTYEMGFKKI